MARQLRGFIEGTIDGITFYKMEGAYYARMKSSLSGKRFWKDRVFEASRRSSVRFGEGNQLASELYRMVEKEKRVYSLFCFLKQRAILLLKAGKSLEEAEHLLVDYLADFGWIAGEPKEIQNKKGPNRNPALVNVSSFENSCESKGTSRCVQPCKYGCSTTLGIKIALVLKRCLGQTLILGEYRRGFLRLHSG